MHNTVVTQDPFFKILTAPCLYVFFLVCAVMKQNQQKASRVFFFLNQKKSNS